jgi:hypothetical protein
MTTPILSPLTPDTVNEAVLQQAADELNIGVPIRAYTVENGRLILFLAYGGKAEWTPPELRDQKPTTQRQAEPIPAGLDALLRADLEKIARRHHIPGWKTLRKAELIAALKALQENAHEH